MLEFQKLSFVLCDYDSGGRRTNMCYPLPPPNKIIIIKKGKKGKLKNTQNLRCVTYP